MPFHFSLSRAPYSSKPVMSTLPSPALPWEVIEMVIGHSANSVVTLYSLTLTCRNLRPYSTILLFCRVELQNRVQLFDLCMVLQAKPHLQPCVQSVSIPIDEFSPHPLLSILPNLSEIKFEEKLDSVYCTRAVFHPAVMTHCRHFGKHIQTLSLIDLEFSSLSTFSDVILSFPRIDSLSCKGLFVKNDGLHQELVARRLSERLRLRTLTVSICHPTSL